ncbi:MAG: MogA/MoaB family molybdenum cofactor biosynthesis protein [Candidatus Eisenbacteria bacterium]|nr:MogA/MoaB family molybdenum cofactor biosynthesis protein [Candidatus Eisenbacteria bacterium]
MEAKWRAAVVTVSDRASRGESEDRSGPLAARLLEEAGLAVVSRALVPDERERIEETLRALVDRERPLLVVTVGGTGFMPRDVTPEATLAVIEKRAPGVEEEIRRSGVAKGVVPAPIGRGVSGLVGRTWIVNLPGSMGAVRDGMEAIRPIIDHALKHLGGTGGHD